MLRLQQRRALRQLWSPHRPTATSWSVSLAGEDMGLKHLAADYRKRASLNAREKARGQSSRRSAAVHTPGPAEPTQGILLGNWGNVKGADLGQDEPIEVKARLAKASKFMSMFAKPEEQGTLSNGCSTQHLKFPSWQWE